MNLVKCSNCQKTFIAEDFELHNCDISLKEAKMIDVEFLMDGSHDGKIMIFSQGLDGVFYTLKVKKREAIPLPDEFTRYGNQSETTQNLIAQSLYTTSLEEVKARIFEEF